MNTYYCLWRNMFLNQWKGNSLLEKTSGYEIGSVKRKWEKLKLGE